jgi:flagellin
LEIDFSGGQFNAGTTITNSRQTFTISYRDNPMGMRRTVGSITIAAGVDVASLSYSANLTGDPILTILNQGYNTQNYRVGTGSNNNVSNNLFGINTTNLGLSAADLTTKENADAAGLAAKIAIDLIASARSEVGAAQNRMSSAETNNATAVENLESARSAYLDLDVAAEMAVYTSKQILVQAGISMISQANQKGESLLKLFQ